MKREIDTAAILHPISDDKPAGEDLRYSPVFEEIKEARRSDDSLDRGEWEREIKTSDWDKVITVAVEALTNKTKDLQIAAWLIEALTQTEGFGGLFIGLRIINGLLSDYWEHLYPRIEDGDLDFRAGPIEFINEKVWTGIKQVPFTDSSVTTGYSWFKWQESRQVGSEAGIRNQYGDVDDNKKKRRDELIVEGKLTAENFDAAVSISSRSYYEVLGKDLEQCRKEFKKLDKILDEKFGSDAPRLAEFRDALEECERFVAKVIKDKKKLEPAPEPGSTGSEEVSVQPEKNEGEGGDLQSSKPQPDIHSTATPPVLPATRFIDSGSQERIIWDKSLAILESSGIKKALNHLLGASCNAPSLRERNRCRLLMAKLCLKAERPDLARPIVEELNALIEELHLERWESPLWIAEVLDALYQCLTAGKPSNDDLGRAKVLFQRLCTTDVTKAMTYKV